MSTTSTRNLNDPPRGQEDQQDQDNYPTLVTTTAYHNETSDEEESRLTVPTARNDHGEEYQYQHQRNKNDEVNSPDNQSRLSIDPPEEYSMSTKVGRKEGDHEGDHESDHVGDEEDIEVPPLDEPFLAVQNDTNKQQEEGDRDQDQEGLLDLEEDTYTLLLVTTSYGIAFWFAILICGMQVGLISSILEQMLSKTGPNSTGGTFLNIPFANTPSVQFGQFIAILFGLLTQRDLLQTVPLLIALWEVDNWKKLNTVTTSTSTPHGTTNQKLRSNDRLFWWEKIFVTYFLRVAVSVLALFTAFILIIQSTDIIDLVKDFTGKCSLFLFFISYMLYMNM